MDEPHLGVRFGGQEAKKQVFAGHRIGLCAAGAGPIRTARARTSGLNLFLVLFIVAPVYFRVGASENLGAVHSASFTYYRKRARGFGRYNLPKPSRGWPPCFILAGEFRLSNVLDEHAHGYPGGVGELRSRRVVVLVDRGSVLPIISDRVPCVETTISACGVLVSIHRDRADLARATSRQRGSIPVLLFCVFRWHRYRLLHCLAR